MSVYSGFATRQQETLYNNLLFKGLTLLVDKVMSTLCASPHDTAKWSRQLGKVIRYLSKLEEGKFLPPKFSTVITPLIPFLKAGMVRPHQT
jgi:hypothetical protein